MRKKRRRRDVSKVKSKRDTQRDSGEEESRQTEFN
jgi:hypothetical protein